jgi:protein-S-isoprenylcysteine O-methyltransferase Ste14
MAFFSPHQRQRKGTVLVVLQFGLLLFLAWMAAPRAWQGEWPPVSVLLAALSVALAAWTLVHNRLGNFNIHPAPKTNGTLITNGPYRRIRHPMYSAVLLGGAALAAAAEPSWAWLVWAALAGVLWVKASLEETWLSEHYPPYAAYCNTSKRFIPWLL